MNTVLFLLEDRQVRFAIRQEGSRIILRPVEYLFQCIYNDVVLHLEAESTLFEGKVDAAIQLQVLEKLPYVWKGKAA